MEIKKEELIKKSAELDKQSSELKKQSELYRDCNVKEKYGWFFCRFCFTYYNYEFCSPKRLPTVYPYNGFSERAYSDENSKICEICGRDKTTGRKAVVIGRTPTEIDGWTKEDWRKHNDFIAGVASCKNKWMTNCPVCGKDLKSGESFCSEYCEKQFHTAD